MNAEVIEMPEYNVAYVRKIGPYGKKTCEQSFTELAHYSRNFNEVLSLLLVSLKN